MKKFNAAKMSRRHFYGSHLPLWVPEKAFLALERAIARLLRKAHKRGQEEGVSEGYDKGWDEASREAAKVAGHDRFEE